jgi:hypothetical protein
MSRLVSLFREGRPGGPSRLFGALRALVEAGFLLGGAALLLAARLRAIVYPLPLNPDEAQLGANALRVLRHGSGWGSLDGFSSGPLNSLALAWPALLGKEVSLVSVRLTAWIAVSLVFVLSYLAIRRVSGRFQGVLFSLPLLVFLALNENAEFQHYSSELVSCVLLTASMSLVPLGGEGGPRALAWRSLGCGLLAGAVPFAKLQAVPIALVVFAFAAVPLLASRGPGRLRAAVLLALGPTLWSAVYLLPLLATGQISTFYSSYIEWASWYVREPLSLRQLHKLMAQDGLLTSVVYFVGALSVVAALLGRSVPSRRGAALAVGTCLAGVFAVVRPGNSFPHYLMLLVPFVVICGGVMSRLEGRWRRLAFLGAWAGIAFLGRGELESALRRRLAGAPPFATELEYPLEMGGHRLFSWIADSRSELLVWGWMPQWYLATGLCPATRETMTSAQIGESPLRESYRRRFMEDLRRSAPGVIVDAVKPEGYEFRDSARQGVESFADLRRFVEDAYAMVPDFGKKPKCPDIYVRRDLLAERVDRLILPARVEATATLGDPHEEEFAVTGLFDSSVTEDVCVDYWLLPDRRTGLVDVTLEGPEPVAKVLILNTQNGVYALDRAADLVRVDLVLGGQIVASREARLRRYPDWTEFEFAGAARADALRVTIASFRGKGGGLNEIKILRR